MTLSVGFVHSVHIFKIHRLYLCILLVAYSCTIDIDSVAASFNARSVYSVIQYTLSNTPSILVPPVHCQAAC